MRVLVARNVCAAWHRGAHLLSSHGLTETSRAGDVCVMDMPVTTVYEHPTERVLFCPSRDANPFFHLFESIWMLAGRSDATWLDTYVSDFSSRFGERGGHMYGAYGERWRHRFLVAGNKNTVQTHDQLVVLAEMLRTDPTTRRAVLTMWDPWADLGRSMRDHPCNTHAYFRARPRGGADYELDLTVLCRSNDIVWGAYGANAVHMSVLLEWMAAATGFRVGRMYQVSNNYHAYSDVFEPIIQRGVGPHDLYYRSDVASSPLFSGEPKLVLGQVRDWCDAPTGYDSDYNTQLFRDLLMPMAQAHRAWTNGEVELALRWAGGVRHTDWRRAALDWFQRRIDRRAARGEARLQDGPENGGSGEEMAHVAPATAGAAGQPPVADHQDTARDLPAG